MQDNRNRKLRPEEAAEYVGLSRQTLAKLRCSTSDGPTFSKLGRAVVYDVADLDAWVFSRRRLSTSDRGEASPNG